MKSIRRASERGHANHGWLDSHHTFSFADYYDPKHMGFRALRVLNDDRVDPGAGFPTHGHREMEIVSYVLEGALGHRDSTGTGSVIKPGDVQRMSAGSGVRHSEMNASKTEPVHFLQIWLVPNEQGIAPGYEQKTFPDEEKRGRLRLVASPDAAEGSVRIHADTRIYAALVDGEERIERPIAADRYAWVHVARGSVLVNGELLGEGDALALEGEPAITLEKGAFAEVLVFDLG